MSTRAIAAAPFFVMLACAGSNRGTQEAAAAVPMARSGSGFEESCRNAKLECVHNLRITLRHDDGTSFHFEREWMPPLLQPNILTLYPGYKVYVEAEPSGDSLLLKRTVPSPVNPESTLTFLLEQLSDGKMQLTTKNRSRATSR